MLLLEAFFMLSGSLLTPIYAIFVQNVGGDILDAGIASFAFMVSTGTLVFFLSRLENKFKHQERLYLLGYVLSAIGYTFYLFVTNKFELFAVQVFLGISYALYLPVRDALYTRFLDKGKEALEWGEWETEDFVIPAIAAIVGAGVASTFGFQYLFMMMSGISMIGFFLGLYYFVINPVRSIRKR